MSEAWLRRITESLDWVGLSVDSSREDINQVLGRGNGRHVKLVRTLVPRLRQQGIRIKVNTVVTKPLLGEDMTSLMEELRPDRWKVFQVLPISGENDDASDLLVTESEFREFVSQHAHLNPIAENNDDMTGSYVMIDPEGRFFDNVSGSLQHSRPILDIGVVAALNDVQFSASKFKKRGGEYCWDKEPATSD